LLISIGNREIVLDGLRVGVYQLIQPFITEHKQWLKVLQMCEGGDELD